MRAAFVSLALGMAASARPMRRDAIALANGQAAITLKWVKALNELTY